MTSAGLPACRHGNLAIPSAQAGDQQGHCSLAIRDGLSSLQAAEEAHVEWRAGMPLPRDLPTSVGKESALPPALLISDSTGVSLSIDLDSRATA